MCRNQIGIHMGARKFWDSSEIAVRKGNVRLALLLAVSQVIAPGLGAKGGSAAGTGPGQDQLVMTINDGLDGKSALHFNWPLISVGTGQYEAGPTGLTVFRFARRVHVAVDARGGGPGTINTDYIRLAYDIPELDALVLSGGTWYGLETATAVNTAMLDDGQRDSNWDNVGLVAGSIIYDMGDRRLNDIYPDKRLAQATYRAAKPGVFPIGAFGGGRSALFGSTFGCNVRSGQGGAFRQIGDLKIAAFTVVNALGVVVDRDGKVVACNKGEGWPDDLRATDLMGATPESLRPGWNGQRTIIPERRNTTISVVIINRKMTMTELNRLAVQVHTSMARGIQPFATELDGDVLYAISTAEIEAGAGDSVATSEIGTVASELMWDAILSAVPVQPAPPPTRDPGKIAAGNMAKLSGTYIFSRHASLRVYIDAGRVYAEATGGRDVFAIKRGAAVELLPAANGNYSLPGRYTMEFAFVGGTLTINPGRWHQTGTRRGPPSSMR